MPDSAKNFTYDGTNGPISTTTVTRAELITAMEHLNYAEGYNIRAIDELGGTGLVSVDSLGNAFARSIAGSNGLSVSNATGVSGNPTVGIGTPSTVRQAIDDTEANTITNSVAVSILSSGTSYAVPAPSSGVISRKTIINNTASMITLTGAVWEDPSITTVRIVPRGSVTLVSGVGGFWHVIHPHARNAAGAIYVTTPQATSTTDNATYYEDNSVYVLNNSESVVNQFALDSDSRLKYTGKVPVHAHVSCSFSTVSSSSVTDVTVRLQQYDASAASTVNLTHSKVTQNMKTDPESTALHGDCVMEEGDYLYLAINHGTNSTTVTTQSGYLFALGMPILTT